MGGIYPARKSAAGSAPGRRIPPLGLSGVGRRVTLRRKDLSYLLRLAREAGGGTARPGGVGGEIRKAIVARRHLRHDLRGQLNALRLTADCVRRDLYTLGETGEALDSLAADLAGLLARQEQASE